MEKPSSFLINGGIIRLPIGYRFCPTDEELIGHYLKRKIFNLPYPSFLIPEFDIFFTHPWGLPGDLKEKRYFFSKQKGFLKRRAGCGIWKSIGKKKLIIVSHVVVGFRKTLVFSESNEVRTSSTRWVMHEYRLARSVSVKASNSTQIEGRDWAVYCLFRKRRSPKRQEVRLTVEDGWEVPQPCSSTCSSGVTELYSNRTTSTDQEDNSSTINC